MNEIDFSNIFIKPLFEEKISLKEIDENNYDEILNLCDKFLIPSKILNNILHENVQPNKLIEGLKKQLDIATFKNLINKKEILKIADLFNKNNIDHVFLKGSAINQIACDYTRHSRDIDILVSKESLHSAYELIKTIGYSYKNKLVSDESKYIRNLRHLPILSNKDNALVELHHRVTSKSHYKDCPLAELMLNKQETIKKKGVDVKIPDLNHLIIHIIYHAALSHKFDFGPIFLYDVKHLISLGIDNKELKKQLEKIYLIEVYEKILKYIDNKNHNDYFQLYKRIKLKLYKIQNPKKLRNLIFTRKGRKGFMKIVSDRFRNNEDLYQISKYSLKFYLVLLVEFKDHLLRLFRI